MRLGEARLIRTFSLELRPLMDAGRPEQHQVEVTTMMLVTGISIRPQTPSSDCPEGGFSVRCPRRLMPSEGLIFYRWRGWSGRNEPADHAAALSSLLKASQISSISVSTASRLW
jgi:hypothetical protein